MDELFNARAGAGDGQLFEQAAELLKLNAATVRRYCCTGRIRKACRVGRSYRIPAEALELFMELNPKPSDNVPA